jgi:selenide, water dikinase
MRIDAAKVPMLAGAIECARAGFVPGGLKANRDFAECVVEYGTGVDEATKILLYDPQTAGGLLLSIAAKAADRYIDTLNKMGGEAIMIGEILPQGKPLIQVV